MAGTMRWASPRRARSGRDSLFSGEVLLLAHPGKDGTHISYEMGGEQIEVGSGCYHVLAPLVKPRVRGVCTWWRTCSSLAWRCRQRARQMAMHMLAWLPQCARLIRHLYGHRLQRSFPAHLAPARLWRAVAALQTKQPLDTLGWMRHVGRVFEACCSEFAPTAPYATETEVPGPDRG